MHLTADKMLSDVPDPTYATLSYQSDVPALQMDTDSEELQFHYTFAKESHVCGYPRVVLHMSSPTKTDMDVYVQLRKASSTGTILSNLNIPLTDLARTGCQSADDAEFINSNF